MRVIWGLYIATAFAFARVAWRDWVKHRDDDDPTERRLILGASGVLVAAFAVIALALALVPT